MKGRLVFLILPIFILFAAFSLTVDRERTAVTTENFEPVDHLSLMIATDLHYLAPELTDHGPYFQKVIRNADGKMTEYAEDILEAFIQQTILKAPEPLFYPAI